MPTTYSGPIRVNGSTGKVDPATLLATREVTIAVAAQANTDFSFAVPKCRITRATTHTTVAFGAATDATLQLGSTVGGAEYVAPVSIKNQGSVQHALVASGLAGLMNLAEGATIRGRIVQTGAPSATGSALLFLTLVPLA